MNRHLFPPCVLGAALGLALLAPDARSGCAAPDSLPTPTPTAADARDSSFARAPAPDSSRFWIPLGEDAALWRADRLRHFTLSATLVLGARAAGVRDLPAAGVVLALGVTKEVLDARRGGGASRIDLVFDAFGLAAGLLIAGAAR